MKQDIYRVVVDRCCPGCGHIIEQLRIDRMRLNIPCPKCSEFNISTFKPMREFKVTK